jgi:hypothetical protein
LGNSKADEAISLEGEEREKSREILVLNQDFLLSGNNAKDAGVVSVRRCNVSLKINGINT